jgi:hypothetical protein
MPAALAAALGSAVMVPAPHADAAAMRGRPVVAYRSSVGAVTRGNTATGIAGTPTVALGGGTAAPGIGAVARTGSWSITPTPEPQGGALLSSVSCVRASQCVAVGESAGGPLAEVRNGSTWSITPTPDPSPDDVLYAVSCVRFSYCVAVGQSFNGGDQTLVEVWNGATWSISPSPNPDGVIDSHLFAVSCVNSSYCVAVGTSFTGSANQTLAERWNGTTWSISPTPNPSGVPSSILTGDSCASPSECAAVGYSNPSGQPDQSLAMVWNGMAWSITPVANPSGATQSALGGVSCPQPSKCTAVGYSAGDDTSSSTLAEVWNGTTWSISPSLDPAVASASDLQDVSCLRPAKCTAVGESATGDNGRHRTLAEVWNGATWSITPTPNPRSAAISQLVGVSCATASQCVAVGSSENNVNNTFIVHTLAEAETPSR